MLFPLIFCLAYAHHCFISSLLSHRLYIPQSQDEDHDYDMNVEEPEETKAMDVDDADDDNEADEEEDLEEVEETDVRRSRRSRRQPDRLAGGKRPGRSKYTEDGGVSSNEDDDDDDFHGRRNSTRSSSDDEVPAVTGARRSARSTKNKGSMKEPTDSVNDLFAGTGTASTIPNRPSKTAAKKKASKKNDEDEDFDDFVAPSPESPSKMRGRHSRTRRKSRSVLEDVDSGEDGSNDRKDDDDYIMDEGDDYYSDDESHEDDAAEDDEDDETMKIQRILASRSETRKRWKEICGKMNSSEVTDGSRWFQGNQKSSEEDDEVIEERFLVKWNGLSYLHVTWETQQDLLDQVENAKGYMSTFFRKSTNGVLFTQDERKDGDYFDPGFVQIDRILEVTPPDGYRGKLPTSWEEEMDVDPVQEYGVVMDKANSRAFDSGVGRQVLIKYSSLNYSEASYEFERDLMLMDVDFRDKLKEFYERTRKPSKSEISSEKRKGEEARRRAYVLFGENSNLNAEQKQEQVTEYQQLSN